MNDPVQMLIDAGAIPASPFDAASRYHGVALALLPRASGEPPIAYVRRRFMPRLRDVAIAAEHVVGASERPELLAARYYGEPLYWWRIADANAVAEPLALTDTPGARVAIPVPGSAPGRSR